MVRYYRVASLAREAGNHLYSRGEMERKREQEGRHQPVHSRPVGQARTSQAAGVTDGHIAFRGSISPRFRGCNSRKVVSGPCFARRGHVSRRMCVSVRDSSLCLFSGHRRRSFSSPPSLTRLFSFPLISVRCSSLFYCRRAYH